MISQEIIVNEQEEVSCAVFDGSWEREVPAGAHADRGTGKGNSSFMWNHDWHPINIWVASLCRTLS